MVTSTLTNAGRIAAYAVWTGLERVARAFVAALINLVTIPVGLTLALIGSLVSYVAYDTGSRIRMRGLETLSWGGSWWPAEVEIDWKDGRA